VATPAPARGGATGEWTLRVQAALANRRTPVRVMLHKSLILLAYIGFL
jgi:hypothetical protein